MAYIEKTSEFYPCNFSGAFLNIIESCKVTVDINNENTLKTFVHLKTK